MFRSFFANRRWLHWSALGSVTILVVTWYKVQLDVPDQRVVRRLLRHPAEGAGRAGRGGVPGLPRQVPHLRRDCRNLHRRRGAPRILRSPLRLPLADRDERLLHVVLAPGASHRRRGPARAGRHDALRPYRRGARRFVHAIRDDALRVPSAAVGPERARHRAALDRTRRPLARLPGDRLRRGRDGAARHRGHQAPGPGVQQPEGGGRLPQGAGLRRGRRGAGGAGDGHRAVRQRAQELLPALQALPLLRHREVVLPPVRGHRALHHAGPDHRRRGRHPRRAAADPACVRPGGDLVPVSRELVGNHCRADLDLQATEGVRVPDQGRQVGPPAGRTGFGPGKPRGREGEALSPRAARSTPR